MAGTIIRGYGPGTARVPVTLNLMACNGHERRLADCRSGSLSGYQYRYCHSHLRDAGVSCMLQTGDFSLNKSIPYYLKALLYSAMFLSTIQKHSPMYRVVTDASIQ